jgi:hypothetical protein
MFHQKRSREYNKNLIRDKQGCGADQLPGSQMQTFNDSPNHRTKYINQKSSIPKNDYLNRSTLPSKLILDRPLPLDPTKVNPNDRIVPGNIVGKVYKVGTVSNNLNADANYWGSYIPEQPNYTSGVQLNISPKARKLLRCTYASPEIDIPVSELNEMNNVSTLSSFSSVGGSTVLLSKNTTNSIPQSKMNVFSGQRNNCWPNIKELPGTLSNDGLHKSARIPKKRNKNNVNHFAGQLSTEHLTSRYGKEKMNGERMDFRTVKNQDYTWPDTKHGDPKLEGAGGRCLFSNSSTLHINSFRKDGIHANDIRGGKGGGNGRNSGNRGDSGSSLINYNNSFKNGYRAPEGTMRVKDRADRNALNALKGHNVNYNYLNKHTKYKKKVQGYKKITL